jgi:hypothetical protein
MSEQKSKNGVNDPLSIPLGEDNQLIDQVSVEMKAEDLVTFLRLDDARSPRYSPPKDLVSFLEMESNESMRRLEAMGLTMLMNPFSFRFTDT